MTVGAVEGLIAVEQGLHLIGAGRYILESLNGITEDRAIDSHLFSRPHSLDLDTEDLDGVHPRPNLKPGFVAIVC